MPENKGMKASMIPRWPRTVFPLIAALLITNQAFSQTIKMKSRDPALWPFDAQSVFNHPIGSAAQYLDPQPATDDFTFGARIGFNVRRWSKNVWIAVASDPVRQLVDGDGTIAATLRIPDAAVASGGRDSDIVFINETHSYAYEAGRASKLTTDDWRAGRGLRWWRHDLKGSGTYGSFHSSDAWGNAALGGLLRRGELDTGIFHVLQASIDPHVLNGGFDGSRKPILLSGIARGPGYTWPANTRDKPQAYGTKGNLYLGTLLAIPPSVNIHHLGIADSRALVIAQALQDYGLYLTHVGGVGARALTFVADGAAADYFDLPSRSSGSDFRHPFWDGLSKAVRELRIVSNNLPSTIGGGGVPRRPFAPPFP